MYVDRKEMFAEHVQTRLRHPDRRNGQVIPIRSDKVDTYYAAPLAHIGIGRALT
jgi:hypothetical protein